jgi:hypothetical protein
LDIDKIRKQPRILPWLFRNRGEKMLTLEMVEKLRSVGFSFPQLEHECNRGKTYFLNGKEYIISGNSGGNSYYEYERMIAKIGVWLPDVGDLFKWLELTGHNVTISYKSDERYYYGEAENAEKQTFKGSGPTIECCLYKIIYKICRDSDPAPVPEEILILDAE